jgi:MFS family permease
VFLTNIFIATMSIFQNRYLKNTRGYSATLVALFTVATSSPASIGLVLGGRVADERGRRVLGSTMVPLGAILLALSFATAGTVMWLTAIAGGVCLGVSYPALAVYRGELFPTRTRGLAGGIIMTSALMGGIIGLLTAGWTIDAGASYGTVLLALSAFPIIASLIVWFRYPETAHMELEDITQEA